MIKGVQIQGFDQLRKTMRKLRREHQKALGRAVVKAGEIVREDAVRRFAEAYPDHLEQPPAGLEVATGQCRKGGHFYGLTLGEGEDGTGMSLLEVGSSKNAPGGFMRGAVDENREEVAAAIGDALQRILGKGRRLK